MYIHKVDKEWIEAVLEDMKATLEEFRGLVDDTDFDLMEKSIDELTDFFFSKGVRICLYHKKDKEK